MNNEHLKSLLVATSHQIFILTHNIARSESDIARMMKFEQSPLNSKEIDLHLQMLKHRREELERFQAAFDYYKEEI